MKTDNIGTYKVAIFKCSNCSGRAVPVNGFGVTCPHCDTGTLSEKTPAEQTVELTDQQAEMYADEVLSDLNN